MVVPCLTGKQAGTFLVVNNTLKCNRSFLNVTVQRISPYEDTIRPFEVNANVEFTDVWTFPSVKQYKGKHPAEKPIEMLEHCIKATTFEGDIVLDCFAGSGSTSIAALRTKRKCIAIEIDKKWCESIINRISIIKDLPQETALSGQTFMKSSVEKTETQTLFNFACASV